MLVSEATLLNGQRRLVLAKWTERAERSMLRHLIAVVSRPGILSFAGGLPDPELFPQEAYAAALAKVLQDDARALQYGPPYEPLKAQIVSLMAQRGVHCRPEQIFVTTGAQQALDVLACLLLNPNGQVILEENVYTGIRQAVAPNQPNILSVPTDLDEGMEVEAVAERLYEGVRPAFIYAISEAHNPLGVSMSRSRRQQLTELARTFGVPIVEDDPYGFLTYDDEALPPLKAFDDEWVFYVGSFSKILAPALRLGWLVAPEALIPQLTIIKEAGDLETSALTQRAVCTLLESGFLPDHLARLRNVYGERRDAMVRALSEHFPADSRWTQPKGGMFVWVELPRQVDTMALLEAAVDEEQIAFVPGHAFALPAGNANHCLRLNFSNATVEQIDDGIERLARVVGKFNGYS